MSGDSEVRVEFNTRNSFEATVEPDRVEELVEARSLLSMILHTIISFEVKKSLQISPNAPDLTMPSLQLPNS